MSPIDSDPIGHVWSQEATERAADSTQNLQNLDALHLSLRGCFQGDAGADAWIDDDAPEELDRRLPREAFVSELPSGGKGTAARTKPPAPRGRHAVPPPAPVPERAEAPRHPERNRDRKKRKTDTLEPGSVIDKYRIDAVLGTGGFAVVYRATHLLLRIPVALKLLRSELIKSKPHIADLLCEEARYMAQLNHPNIVRVFDVTRLENLAYIVMEFIEGRSLADAIKASAPLDPSIVIRIGIDVCSGLKAALERMVIHRDIKPGNILIADDYTAKIVDLGLARPAMAADLPAPKSDSGSHKVSGTPAYMSPEQARTPDQIDFRSDIYSLGVTLYHAATGTLPFKAKDNREYFQMHQREPVPRPESRVAGFPPELGEVLLRMMEKDPAGRPQSYDELIGLLKAALGVLGTRES